VCKPAGAFRLTAVIGSVFHRKAFIRALISNNNFGAPDDP